MNQRNSVTLFTQTQRQKHFIFRIYHLKTNEFGFVTYKI